jgi:hypothetical protein
LQNGVFYASTMHKKIQLFIQPLATLGIHHPQKALSLIHILKPAIKIANS